MNEKKLKAFETAISRHRDELLNLLNSDDEKDKLHLHGAAMDDVLKVVNELKDALVRVKNKTFGQCVLCANHDNVEIERLEQDFTTCVCLSHYSEEQLKSLERDLELTAKVQKELLPCRAPNIPDVQFAHLLKPAGIVSGDYFDFFKMAGEKQGIVIADVMGKGLPASILMANLQATLRTLGPESMNVATLMTRLNDLFAYSMKIIRFISLVIVSIDSENGVIEYCNAGHNPPLYWNDNLKKTEWLKATGPAVGLIKNVNYESKIIKVNPNDVLLLYTDGLVEARDNNGNEFSDERLFTFVKENNHYSAKDFLDNLKKSISSFAKNFHDDITLVVAKFL